MIPLGVLAAARRVGSTPPGPVDPYWANVVSLLKFNGSDGSTSFIDEKGRTWAAFGGAEIDTEESMFEGSSGLFNGVTSRIQTTGSSDFDATGDFTVEAFVRTTVTDSHRPIANIVNDLNRGGWKLFITTGGVLGVQTFKNEASGGVLVVNALSGAGTISANAWAHVAATKQGSLWRVFCDGELVASQTESEPPTASTYPLTIGRDSSGANRYWNGWIDEFRLTKGVARYTSNFTPPSAPFPTGGP